jgi:O-acetylhomoserine (thiol)-lyase
VRFGTIPAPSTLRRSAIRTATFRTLTRSRPLRTDTAFPLLSTTRSERPYLIRPIEHGADIVVHSATKFLGGHGTTLGGVIVDSGNFRLDRQRQLSAVFRAEPSYHGISFVQAAGKAAFVTYVRAILLRDTGATMSPFNAFHASAGCRDTAAPPGPPCRKHKEGCGISGQESACGERQSSVAPGSPGSCACIEKYFPNGGASIFTFNIKGDQDTAVQVHRSICRSSRFSPMSRMSRVWSFIRLRRLTRSSIDEELKAAGIFPNTIRLSIGTEHIDDIIGDLDDAFPLTRRLTRLLAKIPDLGNLN